MQQMVSISSRPQDAYRRQDVLTASPIDLIVMLYDALKKNIVLGRRNIDKKDVMGAHKHLMKAQEIVTALINNLDMSYDISTELLEIYGFILRSIEDANIHKNVEPLEPLYEIVDSLRDAWRQVSEQNKGSLHLSEGRA